MRRVWCRCVMSLLIWCCCCCSSDLRPKCPLWLIWDTILIPELLLLPVLRIITRADPVIMVINCQFIQSSQHTGTMSWENHMKFLLQEHWKSRERDSWVVFLTSHSNSIWINSDKSLPMEEEKTQKYHMKSYSNWQLISSLRKSSFPNMSVMHKIHTQNN